VVPLIVRSRRNLRTLFLLKALMSAAVLALCAALVPFAAGLSGIPTAVLALCTLHFLAASWIEMTGTALRALGRRVDEALLLLVFRFVLVALVIAAPFGLTLGGAAASYAAAVAPALLLSGALLFVRRDRAPSVEVGASLQAILRQAAPMGINSYLAILSTRVELFLLQAFQGPHVVGLFGGATRIVESLLTLPSAIAAGALPSVARDVVKGSRGAAQRTFGLVVWMGVPAAIGLALCASDVLSVLGPGFVEGAPALRILSLALFLCFANAALFHILIAAGDTAVIPRLTGMRVVTAAAVGLILIPVLGLPGAALSFTSAEAVLFQALARKAREHAPIEVARPVSFAVLACAPMAGVLFLWPLSLLISIVVGALLFMISAALILRRGTEAAGLA
jgi:O-antigen/teichoic acid export membrane protein